MTSEHETQRPNDMATERKPHFEGATDDQTIELLTVKQAGAFLNMSIFSIYTLVRSKKIPYCRPAGRLRFDKGDLIAWSTNQRPSRRRSGRNIP